MDWTTLIELDEWAPLASLGVNVEPIFEGLYQVADTQYLVTTTYNSLSFEVASGGPFIASLLWACSKGAALRAYRMRIEDDDLQIEQPPRELLPSSEPTYKGILEAVKEIECKSVMETGTYRIASDGKFVHRQIRTEYASYYFRNAKWDDNEAPYSILWKMKRSDLYKKNATMRSE